jgi:hypothetical protein
MYSIEAVCYVMTFTDRDEVSTMTTRQIASKQRKRKRKSGSAEHVYGVPVPKGLHDAIEAERGNLSKAESLLGCLMIAMEYETDSMTAPYYPDVAQVARDLVRQSINGLDSLVLQQRLLRNKIKEEDDLLIPDYACALLPETSWSETNVGEYPHLPGSGAPLLAEAP